MKLQKSKNNALVYLLLNYANLAIFMSNKLAFFRVVVILYIHVRR